MRLETLQTFDHSDVQTKRQKDKKTERQEDRKTKKTRRQKDKKTKKTITQTNKKTKRQRPKREFNIVMSGQFCTLAKFVCFVFVSIFIFVLASGWTARQ